MKSVLSKIQQEIFLGFDNAALMPVQQVFHFAIFLTLGYNEMIYKIFKFMLARLV